VKYTHLEGPSRGEVLELSLASVGIAPDEYDDRYWYWPSYQGCLLRTGHPPMTEEEIQQLLEN